MATIGRSSKDNKTMALLRVLLVLILPLTVATTSIAKEPPVHFLLEPVLHGPLHPVNDMLCFRYELSGALTDVRITAEEIPQRQTLSVRITDDDDNLLRWKERITDLETRITFKPVPKSTVDVCVANHVQDGSWAYKHRAMALSLSVEQRQAPASSPDYAPPTNSKKKLETQLQNVQNTLTHKVSRPLETYERRLKGSVARERALRNTNEESLDWLNCSLAAFAIACFVAQCATFAVLRKFGAA